MMVLKNPLAYQLDEFCSDKGTKWQSRHHYSTAYHALLDHRRSNIHNLIEVGIGEDIAPSIAAWARYLPNANIYALDNKKRIDIERRKYDYTTSKRTRTCTWLQT